MHVTDGPDAAAHDDGYLDVVTANDTPASAGTLPGNGSSSSKPYGFCSANAAQDPQPAEVLESEGGTADQANYQRSMPRSTNANAAGNQVPYTTITDEGDAAGPSALQPTFLPASGEVQMLVNGAGRTVVPVYSVARAIVVQAGKATAAATYATASKSGAASAGPHGSGPVSVYDTALPSSSVEYADFKPTQARRADNGGDGGYGALDPDELSWKTSHMMREQSEVSQGNSSTYDVLHSDERTGDLSGIDGIDFSILAPAASGGGGGGHTDRSSFTVGARPQIGLPAVPGLRANTVYEMVPGETLAALPAASRDGAARWLQSPASSSKAASAALMKAGNVPGMYCLRKGSKGVALTVIVTLPEGGVHAGHFRLAVGEDGSVGSPDLQSSKGRTFASLVEFLAFHHVYALGDGVAHPLTACLAFAKI